MSLVKTRLRASRSGEVLSPVGVRQPNPYENVRIFLEFAIYQTHVSHIGKYEEIHLVLMIWMESKKKFAIF